MTFNVTKQTTPTELKAPPAYGRIISEGFVYDELRIFNDTKDKRPFRRAHMSKVYYHFKQVLFYLFLIAYIFLIAILLLFKQVSPLELFNADRMIIRTLNLIPFKAIFEYLSSTQFNIWIALMNFAGNIVLFIPLSLYLQIFKKNKKILNSVALVCAISLCVEITQYIAGIGRTDIDDIILNTIGGLLGVLIYKIIYLLLKDEDKTKTTVTFLFCLVCAIFGACYFVLVNLFGYRIKIL